MDGILGTHSQAHVASLLENPPSDWMCRDPRHVDPASVDLDDEQTRKGA
jgi:hypothetical protein